MLRFQGQFHLDNSRRGARCIINHLAWKQHHCSWSLPCCILHPKQFAFYFFHRHTHSQRDNKLKEREYVNSCNLLERRQTKFAQLHNSPSVEMNKTLCRMETTRKSFLFLKSASSELEFSEKNACSRHFVANSSDEQTFLEQDWISVADRRCNYSQFESQKLS